jgi:carbon storage regulator
MLVLSRKPGEKILIGDGITVTVLEVIGHRVRIGISAPDDVRILRAELADWNESPAAESSHRPDSNPDIVMVR